MLKKTKKFLVTTIIFALLLLNMPISVWAQEFAFNPNYLVSDREFFNSGALSEQGIQQFLQAKNSYLAKWRDPLTSMSPARIISLVTKDYGISPKVILATLQKEQSLIENGGQIPSADALDWAMGYAICDGCSKSDPALQDYRGFFNQVKYATAIFNKYYREILESGQTRNGFAPNKTFIIDGQTVIPQNIATSLLYTYTPHIHGNKNFSKIWQKWFSFSYPDGTLLQAKGDPAVWLIQDGQKRPFISKAALTTRGYKLSKIIQVDPDKLSQYEAGPSIKYPQYALLEGPDGRRYLLVDDKKREFESKEVFRQLGFNPEEIEKVNQAELDNFPDGKKITLNDAYPTGALLQNKDTGSVYFVEGNVRYPIIDKSILISRFGKKPIIIPVDTATLRDFVIGPLLRLHDGELVMSDNNPTVYVISQGLRRPIKSASTFEQLGYKWDDIITVPPSVIDLHPLGEIVSLENSDTAS